MAGFQILGVSQLNFYVKSLLEGQPQLRELYIRGEISSFTRNSASGHCYFALKDEAAAVRCVMFRRSAEGLLFAPQPGMRVIVRASATLYERDGGFQLVCYDMQPDGLGAVWLAVQQLRAKLEAEGLFDEAAKKPIPPFPKTVGVVTSPQAAAYSDITTVLARRWPAAQVLLAPAPVQGRGAAHEMAQALGRLDQSGRCDVIILGRGGGSTEDLWEFNSEELARAVAACQTPVISAVGHQRDFTLCDLCADLRAATPSAAAELAVPDRAAQCQQLAELAAHLRQGINIHLQLHNRAILQKKAQIYAFSPQKVVQENRQSYTHLVKLLEMSMRCRLEQKAAGLELGRSRLSSLNPLEILARGYSITTGPGGEVLDSVEQTAPGQEICTRLADGLLRATVNTTEKFAGENK